MLVDNFWEIKNITRSKGFVFFAFVFAIAGFSTGAFCQSGNLEFTENKGQWNETIKYKGVMNSGAFFLQHKGFTMLLHKPEDLQQLADLYHGPTHSNKAKRAVVHPIGRSGVVVHSHAYSVQFVNAQEPVV